MRWRCAIATQHSHQIALLIFANYRFIQILTAYKLVHLVALLRWSFDVFVKIASLNVDVGEKVWPAFDYGLKLELICPLLDVIDL